MSNEWSFKLGRVRVTLDIRPDYGYQYDGEDEDGETQAKLDSREYIAFNSQVSVEVDGHVMGTDCLGGSVYDADNISDFWTDHRTSSPEGRNTLAQKAKGICIGHYFPDMVRIAVEEARKELMRLQSFKVRAP